jgi:hypothetical protein
MQMPLVLRNRRDLGAMRFQKLTFTAAVFQLVVYPGY